MPQIDFETIEKRFSSQEKEKSLASSRPRENHTHGLILDICMSVLSCTGHKHWLESKLQEIR